ncbi:MAG: hypothetical protein ABSF44_10510 [Candidatus Bathyarchaeia archaeon]
MKKHSAKKSLSLVVKVMDDKLGPVDVQITPRGIFCSLCDHTTLTKTSSLLRLEAPVFPGSGGSCAHVCFAVSQPEVLETIKQKQREGWKLDIPPSLPDLPS